MDDERAEREAEAEEGTVLLPFDPRAFLRALWRRRLLVLGFAFAAATLGLVAARKLVPVVFRSREVLLRNDGVAGAVRLSAFEDMARTAETMRAFGRRAGLDLPPDKLAELVDVEFEKRSGLVDVTADAASPARAAELARAWGDAFLDVTSRVQRQEAADHVAYYARRLAEVEGELRRREDAVRSFKQDHAIVDVSKQASALLDQLGRFESLQQEASARAREIGLKLEKMDGIIADLSDRARKEEEESQATLRSRTTLRKQAGRLHERMAEIRDAAASKLRIASLEAELKKYEGLFAQGLVPGAALEERRLAYREARARVDEDPEIRRLQAEVDRLDEGILPKAQGAEGPSALILKEMVVEQMELRLDASTTGSLVAHYQEAVRGVEARLAELPALQAANERLVRDVDALSVQQGELRSRLDEARLAVDAGAMPFVLVQEAQPPSYPETTRRRLVPLAALVLGGGAGFVAAALLALASLRLEAEREVVSGLGLVALGTLDGASPEAPHPRGRTAAGVLQALGGLPGATGSGLALAVTSLEADEARGLVASVLARGLSRLGLRVTLVDLAGGAPAEVEGVRVVGRPECSTADWLDGDGFRSVLERERDGADLVVVAGPPLRPGIDGLVVAGLVDGVVLAVRAGRHRTLSLRRALGRLTQPSPILGAVIVGGAS